MSVSAQYTLPESSPPGIAGAVCSVCFCSSCAVQTTLAKGEIYTTLEVKVNLTRAITKDTGRVRATGRLIHRGRTTSTAEGDIRDGAGNLLAHGTTTCVIFPAKSK